MQQIIQTSFSSEDSLSRWRESTQMYSVQKIIQWSYRSEKTSQKLRFQILVCWIQELSHILLFLLVTHLVVSVTHFAVYVAHFVEMYAHFVDLVTYFVVSYQQRNNKMGMCIVHFLNVMWRPECWFCIWVESTFLVVQKPIINDSCRSTFLIVQKPRISDSCQSQ